MQFLKTLAEIIQRWLLVPHNEDRRALEALFVSCANKYAMEIQLLGAASSNPTVRTSMPYYTRLRTDAQGQLKKLDVLSPIELRVVCLLCIDHLPDEDLKVLNDPTFLLWLKS